MMKRLYIAVLMNCLALAVASQEARKVNAMVNLTSEGQYNMTNDKTNWINLLEINIEASLRENITWISDLISVQNTRMQKNKGGICEDLQVFSNIEDENRMLGLFTFGPVWDIRNNFSLFLGVRNVNLDYFTSPMTSVFTGSSQGIYPTISENWGDMANYPLSAMCLHLEWRFSNNWELKNSFYNGVASYNLTDVFRFRPKRGGIFNMIQLGYAEPEGSHSRLGEYYIGLAYGYTPDEKGKKKSKTSFFSLIEQSLTQNTGLLLEGGFAPDAETCDAYFGVGLIRSDFFREDDNLGVMVNRALFKEGRETDIEVTYSVPVNRHITLQPCLHFIHTTGASSQVAMMRVNISL